MKSLFNSQRSLVIFRCVTVALAACLFSLLRTGPAGAQTKAPYDKETLLRVVRLDALSTAEIVRAVEQRGVNFQVTPDVEAEFRRAGARPELIEALRQNYSPRAVSIEPSNPGQTIGRNAESNQYAPQGQDAVAYYYQQGVELFRQGQHEAAINAFQKVVQVNPNVFEAYFLMGLSYLELNQANGALQAGQQAMRLRPNAAQSYFLVGSAYLLMERNEEALAALKTSTELDPTFTFAYNGLGMVYEKLYKYDQAVGAFQRSIQLDPKNVISYLHLAVSYYDLGQYSQTAEVAQQALRVQPNSAYAYIMLCGAYGIVGKWQESLEAANQAIRLAPTLGGPDATTITALAYQSLSLVYSRSDRYQDALDAALQAARLKPDIAGIQNYLSYAYNGLNRAREAITAAEAALRLQKEATDKGMAHYNLAWAYDTLGQRQKALENYRQAIANLKQAPRKLDADELNYLGVSYVHLSQDQNAINALEQAVSIRPNFAQAHLNLGAAYESVGNRRAAMNEYNTLKTLDPSLAAKLYKLIKR